MRTSVPLWHERSLARDRYQARRDVAIEILPANFARDPARMARFEREAKALASLNHPLESQGVIESMCGAVRLWLWWNSRGRTH